MDFFPFAKDCLREFNYPKIHSMEDSEITDIFSKTNRQFLVSWMFKQMDEGYSDVVENATKDDLADLIYHNGFCHNSEKTEFMNGECDSMKQFEILYRMFKYMKSISDARNSDEVAKTLTLSELQETLQLDTNLFPMYGAKQTLNDTERGKKILEYQEEIERLKNLLETAQTSAKKAPNDEVTKDQLTAAMKNLELNFPDFKRKVLDIIGNWDRTGNYENGKFRDDCAEILEACNTNAKVVLEYMKSMNVVMNFKENNTVVKAGGSNNLETNSMMREFAELCNEVAALKRDT